MGIQALFRQVRISPPRHNVGDPGNRHAARTRARLPPVERERHTRACLRRMRLPARQGPRARPARRGHRAGRGTRREGLPAGIFRRWQGRARAGLALLGALAREAQRVHKGVEAALLRRRRAGGARADDRQDSGTAAGAALHRLPALAGRHSEAAQEREAPRAHGR